MKHIFLNRIRLSLFILVGVIATHFSYAQTPDKDKKTTIRVSVADDEKSEPVEKTYRVKSMNDEERKQFVDKVLDSLGANTKKEGKIISVTIDDGDNNRQTMTRKRKTGSQNDRHDRDALAFNWTEDLGKEFNFDSENFRSQMRNIERDLKPKARVLMRDMENFGERMGDFWNSESNKAASVRDLNVYSNNPDNGILNLRFQVPQKGDLTITVTDVKGKEVGKKEIKDFGGNFVGQIDLKKNTKGTLFVTVVQNEDGAVKRVVIP